MRGGLLTVGLWTALALMLAGMGYVMLQACGLRLPNGTILLRLCESPAVASEFEAERRRGEELERVLVQLQREASRLPDCEIPQETGEVAPEPQPQPEAEPEPQPEPQPPEPEPEPEPEPQRAELPQCPAVRPTEVVVLFDISRSMRFDFDLDPAIEEEAIRRQGDLADEAEDLEARESELLDAMQDPRNFMRMGEIMGEFERVQQRRADLYASQDQMTRELESGPGVDRLDIAKDALSELVTMSPEDVTFSVISFAACGSPDFLGRFPNPARPELLARIQSLQTQDFTALADAIAAAPQFMTGGRSEEEPVSIVLFSDGADTCEGDPCARAEELKAAYPFATINVIAIGRSLDEQQCIADATGGRLLGPRDAAQLSAILQEAAGQELPEECRS